MARLSEDLFLFILVMDVLFENDSEVFLLCGFHVLITCAPFSNS